MPSTLKYIRYRAFYNCRNIEFGNLVITEGVKTIGSYSFYYCLGIKSLKTPTTLFMIAQNAFNNCYNLENVELGEGLRIITEYQTPDNVLESPHSYYNYMKENYTKRIDGAMMLKLIRKE